MIDGLLNEIKANVAIALAEDVGAEDVTAQLLPELQQVEAEIISREAMVLCGQPWVNEVFAQVDPEVVLEWQHLEGTYLPEPTCLCRIKGRVRSILTAERSALNFLQTLSATATKTYTYAQIIKDNHTRLLDTRKTIPGLRKAQKYAVGIGGGVNHRMGLYDAFLIKENHIKACGSITKAISLARSTGALLLVEVEVEDLSEFREALDAHPDRILLDNFSLEMLKQAVLMNQPKRCELEASGGVSLRTIKDIAQTGVDFISVGDITKSVQAIDLSLLVEGV